MILGDNVKLITRTLSVVEGMRMRNLDIKKDRHDSHKAVGLFDTNYC